MRRRSIAARILIDSPSTDLRTLRPFTLVTQIEQQIGSQLSGLPVGSSSGGFTISAHVIATISDAGLRRSLTPVLGFDYSF